MNYFRPPSGKEVWSGVLGAVIGITSGWYAIPLLLLIWLVAVTVGYLVTHEHNSN